MARSKGPLPLFEKVEVADAGSEGKAVVRAGDLVIFVPFVMPGDLIDVQVTQRRRSYYEGKAIRFHRFSDKRAEPFCEHFGLCGGCKWQHMQYSEQLHYKQKQVTDNLTRIGKIVNPAVLPIIASGLTQHYRNKLEYTYANRRWLTDLDRKGAVSDAEMNALGFHIPGMFDKVLDIRNCYLQESPSNAIRLFMKQYALEHGLTFYDVRNWAGFLRNLIIRNTTMGDLMVIVVVHDDLPELTQPMLEALLAAFPSITSLYYVVNPKKNDTISDLEFHHFSGNPFITERMASPTAGAPDVIFRIGPASFYQTNPRQAENLYRSVASFAALEGNETVYDLYTGTGTIANYMASSAAKVVGIEAVAPAVADARKNSALNNFANTSFYAGETEKILTDEFISAEGHPDVIITDPPRSGMHERVVHAIISAGPDRVVYVSCNPATQARDLLLMTDHYRHVKSQPVDMFPHTQHVENIALLERIKR